MTKARTKKWKPPDYLKRNADVVAYFEEALADGDAALVGAALGDIARARGTAKVSRGRRSFKATIAARARRDPRFREALFTEAINEYLGGHTAEGRAILRNLVNATIGFEGLAAELRKPSKSLHRMLAPRGNPSTENFFGIVKALQKRTHVKLRAIAKTA